MNRYIDAEKFEKEMYHEAFETDSDMRKWDSGCWIRYKMFENCIAQQPTADVVEVVRCKDCKHRGTDYCIFHINGEPADEELLRKLDNDFCSYGEKRNEA